MKPETLEQIKTEYQAGKIAFERGEYRQSVQNLEKARELVDRNSILGGEIQIWLVTAYEAAGRRNEALALCRLLNNHPHIDTRKESRRILYILEAPKLQTRPEWLVEIPDLTSLDKSENTNRQISGTTTRQSSTKPRPKPEPEPIDLSKVNTKDNRFIWLALIVGILTIASLLFFSQA